MKYNIRDISKKIFPLLKKLFNPKILKSALFFGGGIILFIIGVIVYGIILNLREVPVSDAMREKGFTVLKEPNIIIDKKNYSLNLYEDTVLIKTYRANFGKNANASKTREGDYATPVGTYQICSIDTSHKYYIELKLNYPNINDITEALRKNMITQEEFDELKFEFYYEGCPKLKTTLGNDISIHGIGEYNFIFKNLPFVFNWTDGSIAVSNEDIYELSTIVMKGTKVVIK
ncbi:MAG TPA: L,D-transpeptidase [Ignavibacteriaceae bacterium]|nr:L,D-transpeptidase [Ignavibacteriaceae bacterium]